tara:strand:- start:6346 stop:6720 length:375 start_codon:yes stop_codon:yes gene_type:complete
MRIKTLIEACIVLAIAAFAIVAGASLITQPAEARANAANLDANHPITPDEMIAFAAKQGREFDPEASTIFIDGEHVQTVITRAWDYDNDRYRAFLDAGYAPHENLDVYYSDSEPAEAIAILSGN